MLGMSPRKDIEEDNDADDDDGFGNEDDEEEDFDIEDDEELDEDALLEAAARELAEADETAEAEEAALLAEAEAEAEQIEADAEAELLAGLEEDDEDEDEDDEQDVDDFDLGENSEEEDLEDFAPPKPVVQKKSPATAKGAQARAAPSAATPTSAGTPRPIEKTPRPPKHLMAPKAKRETLGKQSKAQKRRGKPHDPEAPKAPLAPFAAFSVAERQGLLERRPELKGDYKGLGQALMAAWAEVSDARKEELQASYEHRKAEYDAAMATYSTTPAYKVFRDELQEWKDGRDMRKLAKKSKLTQPKKPLNGFQNFAASQREAIKKLEPDISLKDFSKKVAERWAALDPAEQARMTAEAVVKREAWHKEMEVYRHSDGFRSSVDEQADLEQKQQLRSLKREYEAKMEKTPLNATQLFAQASGFKGTFVQVNAKFKELEVEERLKYTRQAEALRKEYKEKMADFLKSPDGLQYMRRLASIKRSVKVRSARKKFLVDAPRRPPTAQALYAAKKVVGSASAKRAQELWESAPHDERGACEKEAAKLMEDFQRAMDDFRKSDAFQKLQRIEKAGACRGRGSKPSRIKGVAGKVKRQKKRQKVVVEKPASMPTKPLSACQLFVAEFRSQGKSACRADFAALPESERKRFETEAQKSAYQYRVSLTAFEKTAEGCKYKRALDAASRKRKMNQAREKLRAEEPRKPPGAFALFRASGKTSGGGRPAERWAQLSVEEKAVWEKEAKAKLAEYEKALEVFQRGASYKKFERMKKKSSRNSSEGKAKKVCIKRAEDAPQKALSAPQEPDRPKNAHALFLSERRALLLKEEPSIQPREMAQRLTKEWGALPTEERKRFEDQARDLQDTYEMQLRAFQAYKATASRGSRGSGLRVAAAARGVAAAPAGCKRKAPLKTSPVGDAGECTDDVMGSSSSSDDSSSDSGGSNSTD